MFIVLGKKDVYPRKPLNSEHCKYLYEERGIRDMGIGLRSRATVLFVLVWGAAAAVCQTTFASVNLHDGEWEVTTTMQGMQPIKNIDCVTKADLEAKDEEPGCKIDKKISGNTVSIHQTCTHEGSKEDTQMELTYSGDSMKGTLRVKSTDQKGKTTPLSGTVTGRRIGACKTKSK